MKTWKYTAPKGMRLQIDLPASLTEDKTVKVKIEKALMGGFERRLVEGLTDSPDGITVGRFAVGIVSEVYNAKQSKFSRIDRVVVEPHLPCGDCYPCRNGSDNACENMQCFGQTANGLLQDFIVLPESCLHRIPDPLKTDDALIAEHLALAIKILDTLKLEKGEHIAIFSGSKLGVILAQLSSYYRAIPILIDGDAATLDIARRNNIYYTFNPSTSDVMRELFSITGGRRCEKVVYMPNENTSPDDAVDACAFNAYMCIGGATPQDISINLPKVLGKNVTLLNAKTGYGNYPSALNLLTNKVIKMSDFERINLSFETLDKELSQIDMHDLAYKTAIVNF